MKSITYTYKRGLLFGALLLSFTMSACTTGSSKKEDLVIAAEDIVFSNEELAAAAIAVSLRLHFLQPHELTVPVDITQIVNAATPEEAKAKYDAVVTQIINAEELSFYVRNYFQRLFKMSYVDEEKDVVDMALYTIMNDKPYSSMYTLQGRLDPDGNEIPVNPDSEAVMPPVGKRAGVLTMRPMAEYYVGNNFGFNFARKNMLDLLCTNAPANVQGAYAWDDTIADPKYTENDEGDIDCRSCHQGKAGSIVGLLVLRYPYRNYDADGAWRPDGTFGRENVYGHEPAPEDNDNVEIAEPRQAGVLVAEPQEAEFFKVKPNGASITDPAILASELIALPEADSCFTKRILSWVTGVDQGKPDMDGTGPYEWNSTPGEIEFLEDMTQKFIQGGRTARALMAEAAKDPRFIRSLEAFTGVKQ